MIFISKIKNDTRNKSGGIACNTILVAILCIKTRDTTAARSHCKMSFDISKTETFIPFLWISGKFVFFMILVSLFSSIVMEWSVVTPSPSDRGLQHMNVYDRLIFISILQFVLFERQIDTLMTRKNDTIIRNSTGVQSTSTMNLFKDFFIGFGLLVYSKSEPVHIYHNGLVDEYIFYSTQALWVFTSYVVFIYEILQVVRNDMNNSSLITQKIKINENIIQVVVITMLTLSLTSPLLTSVCSTMSFSDFCIRVFLYTCYVCARFYLYGISSHNMFMSPLLNMSLFGWMILVPSIMVYIGFVVPFVTYIVIFSRAFKMQTILPIQAHNLIVSPGITDSIMLPSDDFMTKLKNMEKQQAVDYTSNTKRRQGGSLF